MENEQKQWRTITHVQDTLHFTTEVRVTWSVYDVDLDSLQRLSQQSTHPLPHEHDSPDICLGTECGLFHIATHYDCHTLTLSS
jgi:hypothetical protein